MKKILTLIAVVVAIVVVWRIVTAVVLWLLPLFLLIAVGMVVLWMWKRWNNSKAHV